MTDAAWKCLETIALAFIGAIVTIATAYIAARWHVTRNSSNNSGTSPSPNNVNTDTKKVK